MSKITNSLGVFKNEVIFLICFLFLKIDLKFNPIPGYQGVNRTFISENLFGLTYASSRKKAEETLKKLNEEKSTQLLKSSKFAY